MHTVDEELDRIEESLGKSAKIHENNEKSEILACGNSAALNSLTIRKFSFLLSMFPLHTLFDNKHSDDARSGCVVDTRSHVDGRRAADEACIAIRGHI